MMQIRSSMEIQMRSSNDMMQIRSSMEMQIRPSPEIKRVIQRHHAAQIERNRRVFWLEDIATNKVSCWILPTIEILYPSFKQTDKTTHRVDIMPDSEHHAGLQDIYADLIHLILLERLVKRLPSSPKSSSSSSSTTPPARPLNVKLKHENPTPSSSSSSSSSHPTPKSPRDRSRSPRRRRGG